MRDASYRRAGIGTAGPVPRVSGSDALALGHSRTRDHRLQYAAKRFLDVVTAACGLIVLFPVLLIVGLAVRLESRGPALYRQERIGKDGVAFGFYKFRTMVEGNDPSIHRTYVRQLITNGSDALKGDTGSFKIENDPRVTRLGRFLRRWSIDEVPQLLNVVRGDMSLVGPRPPLPYEAELYSSRALRRLECLPGMTGLWQVSGRCQTTFDEMVELDIEYVDTWSLLLDLKILARTPRAVLGHKGAY